MNYKTRAAIRELQEDQYNQVKNDQKQLPFNVIPHQEYDEFTLQSRWGNLKIQIHEGVDNMPNQVSILGQNFPCEVFLKLEK